MALLGKNILPFVLGMAVGVVFNNQIRQGWQWIRGQVPQIPDIPSFGGTPEPIAEPEPVEDNPAAASYAYKADFEKEYDSHLETYNNGIPFN